MLLVLFFPVGVWLPRNGAKARLLASRSAVRTLNMNDRLRVQVPYRACLEATVSQRQLRVKCERLFP